MFHRSWKRKKNKKRVPSAGVFDIFPFRNSQRKIDPRGHDWKELDSLLGGGGEGEGEGGWKKRSVEGRKEENKREHVLRAECTTRSIDRVLQVLVRLFR